MNAMVWFLCGMVLLCAGFPFAQGLPLSVYFTVYLAAAVVCWCAAGVTVWAVWRCGSAQSASVTAVAALLLLWSLLPPEGRNYYELIAQTAATAGTVCVCIGVLSSARGLHLCAVCGAGVRVLARLPACWVLGGLGSACIVVTLALAWYGHAFLPIVFDSISQYVHAKFIAQGHLTGQSHPLREFFDFPMMINNGKWYSQYPPLHPFLLALGHRIHAPWLINPLLGSATLVATFFLAQRAYGASEARLAALLVLVSPFFLAMSSEYMNHSTALLGSTLCVLCLLSMRDAALAQERRRACLLAACAGVCLGGVILTRPLTAVGVALPFVVYAVWCVVRRPRVWLLPWLVMGLCVGVALLMQGGYNAATTGSSWLFPYVQRSPKNLPVIPTLTATHALPHAVALPVHSNPYTLMHALAKARNEWARMNISLVLWSLPVLTAAALACVRYRHHVPTRLLMAMIVSVTAVGCFNKHASAFFGPRHLYEVTAVLLVLIAAGLCALPGVLQRLYPRWPLPVVQGAVAIAMVVMVTTSWSVRLPEWLATYHGRYMHGYARDDARIRAQAVPPALVFVEDSPRRLLVDPYASVAYSNPPMADAPVIFARDLGEKNHTLVAFYPCRNVYGWRDAVLTLQSSATCCGLQSEDCVRRHAPVPEE